MNHVHLKLVFIVIVSRIHSLRTVHKLVSFSMRVFGLSKDQNVLWVHQSIAIVLILTPDLKKQVSKPNLIIHIDYHLQLKYRRILQIL